MFTTVSVSCFVNPPCHRTRPISAAPEPPTYGPSANTGNMPFREDGPNIEALTGSISKSPLSTYCGVYMLQSAWLFVFSPGKLRGENPHAPDEKGVKCLHKDKSRWKQLRLFTAQFCGFTRVLKRYIFFLFRLCGL